VADDGRMRELRTTDVKFYTEWNNRTVSVGCPVIVIYANNKKINNFQLW